MRGHPPRSILLLINIDYFTIISIGAARTAGGWPHHPRGGETHVDHFTYRTVYRYDYREKQKPPLWQVTVSMKL